MRKRLLCHQRKHTVKTNHPTVFETNTPRDGKEVRMQKLHTRWRRPRTVRYWRHLQGSISLQVLMTVTHLWQRWTSGPSAAAERRREAPFWSDWQEDDRSASLSWRETKRWFEGWREIFTGTSNHLDHISEYQSSIWSWVYSRNPPAAFVITPSDGCLANQIIIYLPTAWKPGSTNNLDRDIPS